MEERLAKILPILNCWQENNYSISNLNKIIHHLAHLKDKDKALKEAILIAQKTISEKEIVEQIMNL